MFPVSSSGMIYHNILPASVYLSYVVLHYARHFQLLYVYSVVPHATVACGRGQRPLSDEVISSAEQFRRLLLLQTTHIHAYSNSASVLFFRRGFLIRQPGLGIRHRLLQEGHEEGTATDLLLRCPVP